MLVLQWFSIWSNCQSGDYFCFFWLFSACCMVPVDETGAVIACSELGQIGEMREGFAVARLTAGDAFEKDGYAYHQFSTQNITIMLCLWKATIPRRGAGTHK